MIIEMNKDIDRYQESVAMGLSAKQLIYAFFKKIKLGNEYSHSVQYWEDKEAKLNNKGEMV